MHNCHSSDSAEYHGRVAYSAKVTYIRSAKTQQIKFICKHNIKQEVKVICQKATSPSHPDSSIVFARWRRQRAPRLIHASLGSPKSTSQRASRLVEPFFHSPQQRVPKIAPSHSGCGPPSNTWFFGKGPTESTTQTTSHTVQSFLRGL